MSSTSHDRAVLSRIQHQKLVQLFRVHDTDNNGVVEREDFERMIKRIATARGWQEDSAEYRALSERVLAQWAAIAVAADPEGSGQVHVEGWLALWNAVLQADYEGRVRAVSELLWELMDRDGSGHITRDESRLWFEGYGIAENVADWIFERCDLNGDGAISRDEWLILTDQFFLSMDPADPGTVLFGPKGGFRD